MAPAMKFDGLSTSGAQCLAPASLRSIGHTPARKFRAVIIEFMSEILTNEMVMTPRATLDQLRMLTTVAETGTFSAAARRLGRVQSAVSQSIQVLEDSLGVALFDRDGRTPRLTEIGRLLVDDANEVLKAAEAFGSRAARLGNATERELKLAVDGVVPINALAHSLQIVGARYPDVQVTIFTGSVSAPEQRLRSDEADMAIYVPRLASGVKGLATQLLGVVAFVPVASAMHPLAQIPGDLSRGDLADQVQLVTIDPSMALAAISGSILSARCWSFTDMTTRIGFLTQGLGWGHAPLHLVRDLLQSGQLKQLSFTEKNERFLSAELYAVHEPGRPPGPAGRLLIAEMRKRLKAAR